MIPLIQSSKACTMNLGLRSEESGHSGREEVGYRPERSTRDFRVLLMFCFLI